MSIVVSDTTPLNYLILVGCVDVLPRLFGKLLVPPAVISEMRHPQAPPPVSAWATNLPAWAEIRTPQSDLGLKIGRGENEAISLAVELADAALLVDDKKARNAAETRGLMAIGTITILDLADELGLLDFEKVLPLLLKTNFHIEAALLDPVRAKVRARKGI